MKNLMIFYIILWTGKLYAALDLLAFEPDNDDNYKCAAEIIEQLKCKSLTLVNFEDDIKFANFLHKTMKYKIILRHYLGAEMNIPNEVYTVMCKSIEDCIEGLQDLVKDRYWNPNAPFCFIIKILMPQDTENLFEKLHNLNVYKTLIINNRNMYFYDFEIGNHCMFTPQAISNYECKCLYESRSSILRIMKQSLKAFYKNPSMACGLKIRINVVKPYLFQPTNNNETPVGFEDEFVKIFTNSFTNTTLEYDTKYNVIGYVSQNFTTTGSLKDVQNGVIDGILGATILSYNRVSAFDFTTPHIVDDIIVTVPKAVKVQKWIVMFTIFKPIIWVLIFVTFFLMQMLEFTLKIYGVVNSQGFNTTKYDTGYLIGKANERSPRYLIILWVLFTWYITLFYQSGLSSVFTKPVYYNQINSVKELLEKDYTLFLNEYIRVFAQGTQDFDLSSLVASSTNEHCKGDLECMIVVASGGKKYALDSRLIYKFYGPKFLDENGEDKLHSLPDPYYHLLMTTYFKKGNPNIERIRFLEGNVLASGLNQRSMVRVIHDSKLKYYKFKSVKTNSLTCKDIAGLYYLFLSGCTLSLITFLCEVIVYRYCEF